MTIKTLAERFKGRGPLINIVLDGWGIGAHDEGDAISLAKKPALDRLWSGSAHGQILTHGHYVGLPAATDIGGSEVGHMTMGAGRIMDQGPTRIQHLLRSGAFFESPGLNRLIDQCREQNGALHLLGLLSDGNVHSHISHFEEVIGFAARREVKRLYVHALLDGRDVPYQSALDYVARIEAHLREVSAGRTGWEYAIASGGGREVITMDRDHNWDKVRRGWEVHVHGSEGEPVEAVAPFVTRVREGKPDIVDQDVPPFVVVRDGKPIGTIQDGDSLVFMNFRGDRAIEFSRAVVEDNFAEFDRGRRPRVEFAGMMVYDEDTNLPPNRLVPTAHVQEPFGKRILELGYDQFRLAETQKYAHVTFFFNGGYREPLDPDHELYHLIPSDKIDSYAAAPVMKAPEIAAKAAELIRGGRYHYGLINFANTDMVGHTGNLAAAIQAAEAVDRALAVIVAAVEEADGLLIITADHGNADEMISDNPKTGVRELNTRHSINPVPVILFDPRYRGPEDYRIRDDEQHPNTLANLLATNYILLGRIPPDDTDAPLFQLS